MLKTHVLNGILFAALSLAGALILYIYFFIHPAYRELLVDHAEDESIRYVAFLVHAYDLAHQPLEAGSIPDSIARNVGRFSSDEPLIKLRVFDAAGKIVFSTLPKEVGRINQYDYFHKQVASGEVYSKTVRKDNFTAEMEIVETDLVETYVPIMVGEKFRGAVETYYDVTRSSNAINRLTSHSLFSLALVSGVLLLLLYYALRHADQSIVARSKAEEKLRRNNEELELLVAERTKELLQVNKSLNDQVAERTLAQTSLAEALIAMEESRDKIDGIIRSVADGLLVVDQDENVVLMNHLAERIVGASMIVAVGKKLDEIVMSDDLRKALSEVLSCSGSVNVDFELERPAPERARIFQIRSSALRDRDGSAFGSVLLLQDVTVERQVEQLKRDFLAMAAHELMTPLASIMGYSELLAGESSRQLKEEQRIEFLNYIYRKAEGLSRIVDDLLDVNRIEAGQQISIAQINFDLCVALERLVEAYRKTNSLHNFVLELECSKCGLYADPIRIEQVLENLLSNAVKYSPAGGEIRVHCSRDAKKCRFSVADHGIGMTSEQVEHIFDKFYRVDTTDTARQGIGLGMNIAKHIIEVHGGSIEVLSRLGEGTTVNFTLPTDGSTVD